MFKSFLLSIIFATLLGACTSTKTDVPQYAKYHLDDTNNSRALVLTHAAGISGLNDTDNYFIENTNTKSSTALDNSLAMTSSGGQAMGSNLSLGEAAALGTAIAWITTNDSAKETKLFAWYPQSEVNNPEEAQATLVKLLTTTVEQAFNEMNFNVIFERKGESFLGVYHTRAILENPNEGCIDRSCSLYIRLHRSIDKPVPTPYFVSQEPSYLFSGTPSNVLDLKLPHNLYPKRMHFLKSLSSYLPSWAFIYTPPYTYVLEGKKSTTPAVVLNKGNILIFEKPQGKI